MIKYDITTGPEHRDDDHERPWMQLPTTLVVECLSTGPRCCFRAWTIDAAALEAALDADDDVLTYEELSPHQVRE